MKQLLGTLVSRQYSVPNLSERESDFLGTGYSKYSTVACVSSRAVLVYQSGRRADAQVGAGAITAKTIKTPASTRLLKLYHVYHDRSVCTHPVITDHQHNRGATQPKPIHGAHYSANILIRIAHRGGIASAQPCSRGWLHRLLQRHLVRDISKVPPV